MKVIPRVLAVLAPFFALSLTLTACHKDSVLPSPQTSAPSAPADAAGSYTNMSHAHGECVGYEVQLWKSGTQMFGLLLKCNGEEGDTPVGLIDHVVFDAVSGKLSFDAKLTTGNDFIDANNQPPAKDYFKFDGVLTAQRLSGKIYHEDKADPKSTPDTTLIALTAEKTKPTPDHYATREAWLESNTPLLQNSGPKW